jgi:hypothetical protein
VQKAGAHKTICGTKADERFGRVLLMKKGLRIALELENEGLMELGIQ